METTINLNLQRVQNVYMIQNLEAQRQNFKKTKEFIAQHDLIGKLSEDLDLNGNSWNFVFA